MAPKRAKSPSPSPAKTRAKSPKSPKTRSKSPAKRAKSPTPKKTKATKAAPESPAAASPEPVAPDVVYTKIGKYGVKPIYSVLVLLAALAIGMQMAATKLMSK